MPQHMRVMGIDPGLTRCGVGVIDGQPGARPSFVAVGVVRTTPDMEHVRRLLAVEQGLTQWFDQYLPDVISIEAVFAQHNLKSVTGVAQVAGMAMLLGAHHDVPVVLHTPTEVKSAVTGSGRADKAQVGMMVAQILHLKEPPKPADAADSLALAITHLWRGGERNSYTAASRDASERQQSAIAAAKQRQEEARARAEKRIAAARQALKEGRKTA